MGINAHAPADLGRVLGFLLGHVGGGGGHVSGEEEEEYVRMTASSAFSAAPPSMQSCRSSAHPDPHLLQRTGPAPVHGESAPARADPVLPRPAARGAEKSIFDLKLFGARGVRQIRDTRRFELVGSKEAVGSGGEREG